MWEYFFARNCVEEQLLVLMLAVDWCEFQGLRTIKKYEGQVRRICELCSSLLNLKVLKEISHNDWIMLICLGFRLDLNNVQY